MDTETAHIREGDVKTQGEDGHLQGKQRGLEQIRPSQPSERTDPANALISDWFKPLGFWSLVMAVPGDMYNAGQGWMRELRACREVGRLQCGRDVCPLHQVEEQLGGPSPGLGPHPLCDWAGPFPTAPQSPMCTLGLLGEMVA